MKIALIGTGNVATHIAKRAKDLSLDIIGVLGSSKEKTEAFAQNHQLSALSSYPELSGAELTIVCVQDDKLEDVLNETLKFSNCVTTSGTFDIQKIAPKDHHLGVFYPLQSFSKNAVIDFTQIPFFIETKDNVFESILLNLGRKIGKEAVLMDAESRINLHITAVFLNNFTNHICALANEFAQSKGIEIKWFEALLEETFRKIKNGASFNNQTGPAQRGDTETIQKHLQLLDSMKAKVYETLSESIQQKRKIND